MDVKNTVQFKRNFWKSIFMAFSIALLTLTAYGSYLPVIIVNGISIFILSFVTTNVVDAVYSLREIRKLKKEINKNGKG